MSQPLLRLVALVALLAAGCGPGQPPAPPGGPAQAAATATAPATPTPAPGPGAVASTFFQAWQDGQYDRLYDLLSSAARAATPRDTVVRRYASIHDGIGVRRLTVVAEPAVVSPALVSPSPSPSPGPAAETARVAFRVTRAVPLFGDLVEDNTLPLVREPGGWRVDWQPGLIFRDLTATSSVRITDDAVHRGRVLDRRGTPLAEDGAILSVGVVPGQIADEPALLAALSQALGLDPETIKRRYQGGQPDWFMPIADRSASERSQLARALGTVAGVVVRDKPARVYPLGEAAAHVVGYVARVTADDLARLADRGYGEEDWIGRAGLEAWGESLLAGRRGGRIAIVDNQSGRVLRTIAERRAEPAADVQLTLDARLQARAAEILGDRRGSVVVLDPRSGDLLAIASRPSFDPNRFVVGLSQEEWAALNGPERPLVFRAAESAYAPASTFKVVTMAAGLERGATRTTERFDCGLEWHGLPGVVLHNWAAQGQLDLVEALAQSCNPAFFTVGLALDHLDPAILPEFARAFGLGQPTGVVGLHEAAGLVPDPTWKQREHGQGWASGDSVNLAIGQGFLLATPLQMANAYAALASGGSLRAPRLVQSIRRADGTETTQAAEEKGRLPIGEATRAAIVEGMRRVAGSPTGSAAAAFRGERVPTAAKTGSAENEGPEAHAWFVGFQTPTEPTVLALVMVEGGQMGGSTAAPLGRTVLEAARELQAASQP